MSPLYFSRSRYPRKTHILWISHRFRSSFSQLINQALLVLKSGLSVSTALAPDSFGADQSGTQLGSDESMTSQIASRRFGQRHRMDSVDDDTLVIHSIGYKRPYGCELMLRNERIRTKICYAKREQTNNVHEASNHDLLQLFLHDPVRRSCWTFLSRWFTTCRLRGSGMFRFESCEFKGER